MDFDIDGDFPHARLLFSQNMPNVHVDDVKDHRRRRLVRMRVTDSLDPFFTM